MADATYKKKLEKLIIDEGELSEVLIDRLRKFIRLTRNGEVVFVIPKDQLPVKAQVLLYLAGKKIARELELTKTDTAGIEEIAIALAADYFTVAGGLNELKNQRLVFAVERGSYTVQLSMLREILDIVEKMQKTVE